jgi:demethylmenaquinone methyltransferase/2-methoxy-6-polyprenyl-1,4-benzoquinol methylase
MQLSTEAPGGSGAMFDRIADRYDLVNRVISFGLDRGWRARAVEALALGEAANVLDVATGTGDLALAIANRHRDARVVGVDPSTGMLDIARRKARSASLGSRVDFVTGDAQALTFADATFDGATIAFGIRNVPDRSLGLREMHRVLRRGSRLVVLELAEPDAGWLGPIARWHVHRVVPAIGAWLSGAPEYDYLQRSIAKFPAPAIFADTMRAAGFARVDWSSLTFGAATLYVGVA